MKLFCLGIILMTGSFSASFALPEIVVSDLRQGTPAVLADGSVAVRVSVTVRNQGTSTASRFKLSAEGMGNPSSPSYYFTIPLQAISGVTADGSWYVWTRRSLYAGESMSFTARIVFTRHWRGRTVRIRVLADSCSGDEFAQPYCRVRESNESNNYSVARAFSLP